MSVCPTKLENEGKGYVVASLGEYGGNTPYTSYNALKSYIKNNNDTIKKFTNAINKGLKYTEKTDNKTLAKDLIDYFPDMKVSELEKMIKRYKDINAWKKTTYFSKKEFEHMEDILIEANELDKKVHFKDLVDNSFNNE
jgi:NitT/TauT family transport system substrate-binding protein